MQLKVIKFSCDTVTTWFAHLKLVFLARFCSQTYIGQTGHNVELRWEEHENIPKDSEPTKHLNENLSHEFS